MDGDRIKVTNSEGQTVFEGDDFSGATEALKDEFRKKFKETPEDEEVRDKTYRVTADELRQFIERWESLDAEKKDLTDMQKEVMAKAKGRGYDTKVIRKVIALRKRNKDEIAEEEAVLAVYMQALGM